jgi:hypothetical protein
MISSSPLSRQVNIWASVMHLHRRIISIPLKRVRGPAYPVVSWLTRSAMRLSRCATRLTRSAMRLIRCHEADKMSANVMAHAEVDFCRRGHPQACRGRLRGSPEAKMMRNLMFWIALTLLSWPTLPRNPDQ